MASTLRIEHDGVELHVEVDGPAEATPVVFLHGVTSSGKGWEWLPETITRGRRIIRIDFRGHGRSSHAPGRYGVSEYGSDVVAVLRQTARAPAVLVGHSLGGVVAWSVAQGHPELVTAALLEDPPLHAADAPPERLEQVRSRFKMLLTKVLSYRTSGLSDTEIAQQMGATSFGPPGTPTFRDIAMDDAVDAMAFSHARLDPAVIQGAIDGSTLAATDVRSPVKSPILILSGDDAFGAAFTTRDQKRLAQTHPDIEVIRIAGCGHGIHDERRHRETFVRHLHGFLDTHAHAVQ
jgi:pimeloyl-ACP methyl ester carboxylesterase